MTEHLELQQERIEALNAEVSSLNIQDLPTPTTESTPSSTTIINPSRSHDPDTNKKRSDPFEFGNRNLKADDDVYEFNAWDNVKPDDDHHAFAEVQYAKQRESPVSDFDKRRFNENPAMWWNKFYKNNSGNFFKDRKWLQQEFPILSEITKEDYGPVTLLEVGAGAGNTAFPILTTNHNPNLKVHACDYSKTAVEVMRNSDQYNTGHVGEMQADVWDAASDELPPGISEESVDIVMMIFIFSALEPSQWDQAVRNIYKVLKPGGLLCFRDYGHGDLAQVRFKKGRYMEENFYARGDGTRVYFFKQEELTKIWTGRGPDSEEAREDSVFEQLDLGVDRRLLVNRSKQLKMYRCWMQGRFRKPSVPSIPLL